jgi:hypothetical protein
MDEGVETYESCDGGEGHAYPYPCVRFHGTDAAGWGALAAAITYRLPVSGSVPRLNGRVLTLFLLSIRWKCSGRPKESSSAAIVQEPSRTVDTCSHGADRSRDLPELRIGEAGLTRSRPRRTCDPRAGLYLLQALLARRFGHGHQDDRTPPPVERGLSYAFRSAQEWDSSWPRPNTDRPLGSAPGPARGLSLSRIVHFLCSPTTSCAGGPLFAKPTLVVFV